MIKTYDKINTQIFKILGELETLRQYLETMEFELKQQNTKKLAITRFNKNKN